MYALSLGAVLREPAAYQALDTVPDDGRKAVALYRERAWAAELASPWPPVNWRIWIQHLGDVERDRYGGTSGYADPAFYHDLYRYLDRHHAPGQVRDVVRFRQAISGWDFAAALSVADPLVAATLDRQAWLPPDELRDGLVMAHLATGDPPGAAQVFSQLAPFSARPRGDFRNALLEAYLGAGGKEGSDGR
jgi:hypothetical protein